jgi:hypothetical protein
MQRRKSKNSPVGGQSFILQIFLLTSKQIDEGTELQNIQGLTLCL